MRNRILIKASAQISVQHPLCEDWMTDPLPCSGPYARCFDPDFAPFVHPMQARRMGKILKRAMATSLTVMHASGIGCPDAIVTGTGLGCIENTECFLKALRSGAEEMLPPTPFIQSTHNTIGSLVAIQTRCHGYNCTYSHGEVSFESALLDAFIQLRSGMAGTALVGAHDETTPDTFLLLSKAGYSEGAVPISEGSVSMMLERETVPGGSGLCEVAEVRLLHRPSGLDSLIASFGAESVMGNAEVFRLFGRHGAASGLGVYAASHLIAAGKHAGILVVNDAGRNVGLVYLKSLCGSC